MYRTQYVLALVVLFLGSVHSWDIAITAGDRLEFYTNGTKTDTIRFVSQNLTAIVYNEVNDKLLYVNKQSDKDAICDYDISSVKHKCYIERNGANIQGLAFDPITEMLFFTDTKESSINWMSFKPGSEYSGKGNLLIKMADGIPTDIAVDSSRGYIYWINTNLTTSTIERARYNGSEREVVINASYSLDLHSLVIDQQTQNLYWIMPKNSLESYIFRADLSGVNKEPLVRFYIELGDKTYVTHPNTLAISNESLFLVNWCSSCTARQVWKFSKPLTMKPTDYIYNSYFIVQGKSAVGIATKYKISEQIQEVQAYKISREYLKEFCIHGVKVNGQSLCKCTPGYIGKRCNVSVCDNYCLQGDCSFNEEGLPEFRCNAGYSGEKCEVNVCHGYCTNNGTCSLNADSEPVCQCIDDYAGDRCQVLDCLNYCLQGDCSFDVEGLPKCRCNAGYNGARCEVNVCHGYCVNNGTCSLNAENEPVCQCIDDYSGDRCNVPVCLHNVDEQ